MKILRFAGIIAAWGVGVGIALAAVVVIGWIALDNALVVHTDEGSCWKLNTLSCWNLSTEYISRATGIDLPDGTVVTSSSTDGIIDWTLHAVIVLPEEAPALSSSTNPDLKITPDGYADDRPIYVIDYLKSRDWPLPQ